MKLVKSSPKNSPKRSLHIYKQLNIVPHCWDSYQLLGRHHTGSNPAMLYLNFSSDGSHWSDGCKCSTSVTCHLLEGHCGKRVRSNSIGKDSCMLGDRPGTRNKSWRVQLWYPGHIKTSISHNLKLSMCKCWQSYVGRHMHVGDVKMGESIFHLKMF